MTTTSSNQTNSTHFNLATVKELAAARSGAMPEGSFAPALGAAWVSDPAIGFEEVFTADRRIFSKGAFYFNKLPLAFAWQKEGSSYGHDGNVVIGRIEEINITEDGSIQAAGHFLDTEDAREYQELIATGASTSVSMDLGECEYDFKVLEVDDEGEITDYEVRFTKAEIAGVTGVMVGAFRGAAIKLVNANEAESTDDETDEEAESLAASAAPVAPPLAWFANPQLGAPTPLTITDDGRVFGHIATWDTCHVSSEAFSALPNACVTPPKSQTQYSHFLTGELVTAEGTAVPVGIMTCNTGHAPIALGANKTIEHYDDTGTAAAFLNIGEDDFGIWVAGATRSDLTDQQIALVRASSPSGDWRRIGSSLELLAVLCVNHPGYPVTRVAASIQTALVASSFLNAPAKAAGLAEQVDALREQVEQMAAMLKRIDNLTAQTQAESIDKLL